MSAKVYLAIPYSYNPDRAFEVANKVSARLMNDGYTVFSPISHSHPVADYLDDKLRFDHEFWMRQDLPLVAWADELHVVCIGEYGSELIDKSRGVQAEMLYAKQLGKTIKIIEYYD